MSIEAMKQALEALEAHADIGIKSDKAITSLRQAIQEEALRNVQRLGQEIEQEPVALPCCGYENFEAVKFNPHNQVVQCHHCGQVYTPQRQHEPCPFVVSTKEGTHHCALSQRQWVGLTEEEYKAIHSQNYNYDELAYAIEAKLKEKNT